MSLPAAPEQGLSLYLIEGGLTAIVFALAFALPGIGATWFSRIESAFGRLAKRKSLSIAVVGASAFLLRLALLPVCPIPLPFSENDFSFLLSADTFASGRLANPTPAMWMHFETIHLTMVPTYASMFFPGQGLILAAAKVLTGQPWYGLLLVTALLCAAICWMLQAWIPPTWALLGGLLAVLRIGLFSYWINTYTGAGSLTALGGTLVLGAFPRFMKHMRLRDGILLALGVSILGLCRPYDGMLLCLPVFMALARWAFFSKNRPAKAVLLRRTALPLVLIVATGAWMGYYDYRAFGSPVTLPYTVDRAEYAVTPYFIWQSPRSEPAYRHKEMRQFYTVTELSAYKDIHRLAGFVPETIVKAVEAFLFYAGIALLVPLIMVRRVFRDRRIRFLLLCVLIMAVGQSIEIFLIPHYLAPFTAAFYAIGLQAMRHLRLWKPGRQLVGVTLVRLTVTLCVMLAGIRVFAAPFHLRFSTFPPNWTYEWFGPNPHAGLERAQMQARLNQIPGQQLVLVRYSAHHEPFSEWVYNAADIDHSKVIWARDMDDAHNRELLQYYKDRTIWLVQPDTAPDTLTPYLSH
jgi:hypothetical protein